MKIYQGNPNHGRNFNRSATNKPRYGPGGQSTTLANNTSINAASSGLPIPAPYDGTLTHTFAVDALVVAMHVNTCSPTDTPSSLCMLDSDVHLTDALEVANTPNALLDNTNDVIPTCLNVLQPTHTSLPLISEVLAACHNHTDMSEIPLTGMLPSDSIVAAVHSTNPNELLSLFVFKDEQRTLQGHAPTTTPPSPQSTGLSLTAHTLLDTGSMAGDFVSKSLLVLLDALTHCYVSSHALNVCSRLDGTCYRCNILVDLGLTFLDDSNIKHTVYVTFSVNPFAKLDLIIGRKSNNQHNLFVLTPTRMGFDPTLVETSNSPNGIGLLQLRAGYRFTYRRLLSS